MLMLNGKVLSYDVPFSYEDINYPANWLRLASYEEKLAIGIVEVADRPVYDQRFYWSPGMPKDHAALVENWVSNTKYTAGTMLKPTDWYVIRQSETAKAVPQDVLDIRAEIRTYSDEKEQAIRATTTTDELAAYITSQEYSTWEEIPEPEPTPEPTPSPTQQPAPEGEDTISFPGNSTSGGFTNGAVTTF